uniref:Glycoprotein ORF-Q n=1 Tax=Elephant endotheliotropic herpesvirus 1A TaxID=759753 RepID=A0AA96WN37_ELHV1|nr:glycoprotein ORF-Q [Elephant endotheliotropic herpesvirus 1A]
MYDIKISSHICFLTTKMLLLIITLLLYTSTYCGANTTTSNHLLVYKLLPPRPYEYAFLVSTPLINCSTPPSRDEHMVNLSVWTTQDNYTVIATNNKTNTIIYNITYVKIPKNNKTKSNGPSNIFTVNNENISKDFTSNLSVDNYISIDGHNITGNHTFIIYGLPNITEKYKNCVKNKTRTLRVDEIPSVCRNNDTKNGTFYTGIFDYNGFPVNSSTIEQHLISNYGTKGHRNCSIRQFIRNYLYNNISYESSICSLNNTLSDNVMSTLSSTFSQSTYSSGFTSTLTHYSSTSVSMQPVSTSSVATIAGSMTSHSSIITTASQSTSSEGMFSKSTGNRYVQIKIYVPLCLFNDCYIHITVTLCVY